MQPLYPPSMIPAWMLSITEFYINKYNDLFFIGTPPPFFEFFMYTEMFVQVPVMIWGIPALLRGEQSTEPCSDRREIVVLTKCRFQDGPTGSVAVRLSGFHLDGDVHV
jgi:hypothetical protein